MSAARLCAAGITLFSCLLFGRVQSAKGELRLNNIRDITEDIKSLSSLLCSERTPLPDAAGLLAASGRSAAFWRGVAEGMEKGLSPCSAYAEAEKPMMIQGAPEVMRELFSSLGSADIDTESKRLTSCTERLDSLIGKAMEERRSKTKLIGSLSMLLGLAAALLIL